MNRLTFAVPPGACDCHIHAYDAAYPLAPTATFKPPHAPLSDYLPVLQALGLTRVVVVQPTGYGFDNRCTQAAVAALAGRARGVAMLAVARAGLPVAEYPTKVIKKALVGTGGAEKAQIQAMLKVLLPSVVLTGEDAADALAVAITHANMLGSHR